MGCCSIVIVESGLGYYDPHVKEDRSYIFNSLVYMGWCKVCISLIKYIPQVLSNFRRKSTIGWNIHNILLDFTGGIFLLVKMLLIVLGIHSVLLQKDNLKL